MVTVPQETFDFQQQMKSGPGPVPRYAIYRIEKGAVVLDKAGAADATYEDFVGSLKENAARWCVIYVSYK